MTPPWFERPQLRDSVGRSGLLTPVLLRRRPDGILQIVRGFGRLQIASSLGLTQVPAGITEDDDGPRLFLEALEENSLGRSLHEIEKALAVKALREKWNLSQERIIKDVLPILILRPLKTAYDRLLALAELPETLLRAVADGLESEVALRLASRPAPLGRLVLDVVERFRLGRNKQREFFELIDDLQAMQAYADPVGFWESTGAATFDARSDLSPNDRWQGVISCLRNRRFPHLREHRRRFRELRDSLEPRTGVEIEAPGHFESEGIRLVLTPTSAGDLERLAGQLHDWSSRDELNELIGLF